MRNQRDETVNLFLSTLLGDGKHHLVGSHLNAAEYTVGCQMLLQSIEVAVVAHDELDQRETTRGHKFLAQIMGTGVGEPCGLLQPFASHQR